MYLEKGIEEFGENHKPSPFTIACPYCGGWAMDVSGIQKVPGGGYVPLPDGYSYFANAGNRDCGVPTFPAREVKEEPKRQTKILIADELDKSGVGAMARAIEYLADCMEREAREIEEVARMIAERTGVSMEAAEGMVLNVLQRDAGGTRCRLPSPATQGQRKRMDRAEEDWTAQAGMARTVERREKNELTRRQELCGART